MVLLLKNLIFTLLVPGTIAVGVPWLIAPERDPASAPVFAVAAALLAVGGAIYAWCAWDFAVSGRGTPLPIDAPRTLVVRGLYRCTRNPMYAGVLLVILGWAVMFRSWSLLAYAACVATCFHLFIVLYEERHLRREFGKQYDEYCARVGRRVPGLNRGRAA